MNKRKKKSIQEKDYIVGEFKQNKVMIGEPCITSLHHCYFEGKNSIFKGIIFKIEEDRILFSIMSVLFETSDYHHPNYEYYAENIFVRGIQPFTEANLKEGDAVQFEAKVFAYHKKNGHTNFALKDAENIVQLKKFEITQSQKNEIDMQNKKKQLERLVCSVCLFNENCNAPCTNKEYRETQLKRLFPLFGVDENSVINSDK